jgi:hypothetical protein
MGNVTNELIIEINGKAVEWADICLNREPVVEEEYTMLSKVDIKALEKEGQVAISEIDADERFKTYVYDTGFINKLNSYDPATKVSVEVAKPQEDISINTNEIEKVYELFKDVSYDDGYGRQYLYGIVMFTDNTWLERREYNGSEWWEHITTPTRPSK